jgi:hypothetical protein
MIYEKKTKLVTKVEHTFTLTADDLRQRVNAPPHAEVWLNDERGGDYLHCSHDLTSEFVKLTVSWTDVNEGEGEVDGE